MQTQTQTVNKLGTNDTGNADRFVTQHGKNVHYVHTWDKWLIWNDFYWKPDVDGRIQRMAKETAKNIFNEVPNSAKKYGANAGVNLSKWASQSLMLQRRNAMLTLAKYELPIAITSDCLDKNKYLLNCLNGTLNLNTGELQKQKQTDLITKQIPVTYNPVAKCPQWLSFIERILPDDNVRMFIQKCVGLALSGETQQMFVFLYGTGANGKSTLLDIIATMLDEYVCRIDVQTLLQRNDDNIPVGLAELEGKRFVVASELPANKKLNESTIKALTGDQTIKARQLYKEPFDIVPEFTLFMAGNHKPDIVGTDDGIWRRVALVPFTVQIPTSERDNMLHEKLKSELEGILSWAVEGWFCYKKFGLELPDAVKTATKEYRTESDVIQQFLDECAVKDKQTLTPSNVTKAALYIAFKNWCERNNQRTYLTQTKFTRNLKDRGYDDKDGKCQFAGQRAWQGFSLLTQQGDNNF